MSEGLHKLADAHGIEPTYVSETGEHRVITDDVKRGLLSAMLRLSVPGVTALEERYDGERAPFPTRDDDGRSSVCFTPEWLERSRVWGVTVQLYGVRSARNHGIGDFEDLASLAEMMGGLGSDFIGVNPLHVLFWTEPNRCSPYSPSTRQFLNPLYIAIDGVEGAFALDDADAAAAEGLRREYMVNYAGVSAFKRRVLKRIFDHGQSQNDPDFAAFRVREGLELATFALFEALSDAMAERGCGSGWHNWPVDYQDSTSQAVAHFAAEHEQDILWHQWLQWIATTQLADVQRRARAAGMRIGLYLDLAVGVAPDGASTWADPDLVTAQARIGAPPDMLNERGQDWGLAPMSPAILAARDLKPFERDMASLMRSAGAIRIDHAMGLQRLYWIPQGFDARGGGFVRYPMYGMLESLAALSHTYHTIIVGEDLGTVPLGFRDVMRGRRIHSYRVFYFEHDDDGRFFDAADYPSEVMACVSTHDLPTLRGWWCGNDIAARDSSGLSSGPFTEAAYHDRTHARREFLALLAREGLIDSELAAGAADGSFLPNDLPDGAFIAVHALLAKSPCRLLSVQIEDMAGAIEQVNLPGTDTQYANWRRKLPMLLRDLPSFPLLLKTIAAIATERRRECHEKTSGRSA